MWLNYDQPVNANLGVTPAEIARPYVWSPGIAPVRATPTSVAVPSAAAARTAAPRLEPDAPEQLADAIGQWLALFRDGRHPASTGMPWLTWRQSAERLKRTLLELRPTQQAS